MRGKYTLAVTSKIMRTWIKRPITRVTRGGQGWGLGTCVSKEIAEETARVLKENMEDFWEEKGLVFYTFVFIENYGR